MSAMLMKKSSARILSMQAGMTLVELMLSITLGLFVIAAAIALLVASKSAYTANDDAVQIQESARHALEIIARAIHQAGYEEWGSIDAAALSAGHEPAAVDGLDARSLPSTADALDSPTRAVNGSDVLALQFHGSGNGARGDGSLLNCAGFGVPARVAAGNAAVRGWSIFFVAEDATGEPELRCKYKGASSWSAVAIARGVESFQVLYGIDTDGDGLVNGFHRADEVDAMDAGLVMAGAGPAAIAAERNRRTYWKKIVAIKVALLMRGQHAVRADRLGQVYDLFGVDYGDTQGASDNGTRIRESGLPLRSRNRLRKLHVATIRLRNQSAGSGS